MSEMDWGDKEHCRNHIHVRINVHLPDLLGMDNFHAYNGYPYLDHYYHYYYVDPQRSYTLDYYNNPPMYGKTWGELDKVLKSP